MGWLRSKKGEASLSVVNNVASPSTGGDNASVIEHMPEVDRGQQLSNIRTSDPYSMKVAHRRLAWMFRLSVVLNVVLTMAMMVAMSAFASLFPLKEVRLALVKSDAAENRIYRIEPLASTKTGFELLLESNARRLVELLLEINQVTQNQRLGEASRMVSSGYHSKYERDFIKSGLIENAHKEGITRSIQVKGSSKTQQVGDEYVFAVDFNQVDVKEGVEIKRKALTAYLVMTTQPQEKVHLNELYENPLGITLKDMTIRERG